jgi:spermidine/putrescine transport system permease protein
MTRLSRLGSLFLLPGTVWLLAFFLVPVGLLFTISFGSTNLIGRPVYVWHPGNYTAIFNASTIDVFGRSLVYAVITVVACAVIGYPVAYTIARFGGRWRGLLVLLAILPWFVDYLIRIYAWTQLLGTGGLLDEVLRSLALVGKNQPAYGNVFAVLIGLVYNYLPFMILPLYVAIDQLDMRLVEASRDLYGTPRQTFFRVTLPSTLPGLAAGGLLVFLPAIGDFATAQLLGSPSQYMIGNLIYGELQTPGALPMGADLTVGLVVAIALVFAALVVLAWGVRRARVPAPLVASGADAGSNRGGASTLSVVRGSL